MQRVVFSLALAVAVVLTGCGGGGGTASVTAQSVPAPTLAGVAPGYGMVGEKVSLTGANLGKVTSVLFNGVPAAFSVISETQLTATVPSGASNGTLAVATPSGTAHSPKAFLVALTDQTRELWVDDLGKVSAWTREVFELAAQNERCNVWFRIADRGSMTPSLLTHYANYFKNSSWPDVTNHVHLPKEFFKEKGDRINILFYKAYDGAGYFWSKDFVSQASYDANGKGSKYKSNEGNYFYINIDSAVNPLDQEKATLFTEGTLTHEFQHLCNAHYFEFDPIGSKKDRSMDSWANEMCSILMESIFARQLDIYIPDYKKRADFKNGSCDFLQWGNGFTQYTATSLFGTFIFSQIPEYNRPNFIRNFLANTSIEGSVGKEYLTSVEDLLATVQDAKLGWTPMNWTPIANFSTENSAVQKNWSLLMRDFLVGLTGENRRYNSFVTTNSNQTISPACLVESGGSFKLKPSSFVIGRTSVRSLNSETIEDASAAGGSDSRSAYVLVFNGTLPSGDILDGDGKVQEALLTVSPGQLQAAAPGAPSLSKVDAGGWNYHRAMGSRLGNPGRIERRGAAPEATSNAPSGYRPTITGTGLKANGGSPEAGYNHCFYQERTR